jgi:hypothetical protein
LSSGNQCAAIEIDDGPCHKADGHEGEDLLRDIFADADAADGKRGGGLGEHVEARGLGHRGADRGVDDPRRNAIDAHRRQFQRQCARQ